MVLVRLRGSVVVKAGRVNEVVGERRLPISLAVTDDGNTWFNMLSPGTPRVA